MSMESIETYSFPSACRVGFNTLNPNARVLKTEIVTIVAVRKTVTVTNVNAKISLTSLSLPSIDCAAQVLRVGDAFASEFFGEARGVCTWQHGR